MIAAQFSTTQVVVVAAAIFFSAMITAVAGFGFGLMSVPLMSLAIDIHSAVIVSSVVGVFGNGVQTYLYRRVRERSLGNRLLLAAIVGLPFGYLIFDLVSDKILRVMLGIGVISATAALARGVNLSHLGRRLDFVLGFTSGVLNTSLSTSGPPLVFDLQARKLAPEPFRGTINFVFLGSGLIGLVLYAAGGKIHLPELRAGLIAAPALGLGLVAGMPLRKHFSPESFRWLVMVLLVGGAVGAVAKAFT